MQIITILNRCHRFRGFSYEGTKLTPTERNTIEVHFRSGKGLAAICSGYHRPAAGYDYPAELHAQFILLSGFRVFLLCGMRWVNCQTCGAVVEETLRARRPSWNEAAASFQGSWKQVCHMVKCFVSWGLEHRTLVYQIDAGLTRLLRRGKERNVETPLSGDPQEDHKPLPNNSCWCVLMWQKNLTPRPGIFLN